MDLNKATLMKATRLLMLLAACTLSSCNSSSSKVKPDEIQKMIDRIIDADDNLVKQQILTDEMYLQIMDLHDCRAELWLSFQYFYICCYNGESKDSIKKKIELYDLKFIDDGRLWSSVKNNDPVWFSNIERCAELIKRAYDDDPSLANKLIEEDYTTQSFQSFSQLVIKREQ